MHRRAVNIFFSYSHKDSVLRDELERRLSRLKREGLITTWNDREIRAGDEWRVDIDERLKAARVILLLISDHFLASGYCMNIEMREAMERSDAGVAKVIPIYLRPCRWRGQPFSELNGLPAPTRPVTRWADGDKAFSMIASGLRAAIEALPERPRRGVKARSSARASAFYTRGVTRLTGLVDQDAMTEPITPAMVAAADAIIATFDRALSLEPPGGPWRTWEYYHRGVAHHCKKELNAAIADYSHAIDLNPENAFAFRQRAIAYYQLEEYRRALADYGRAIKIAPTVAKTYFNRGLLYLFVEKRQNAGADFRKALTVDDDPVVEREAREQLRKLNAGRKVPRAR